MNRGELSISGLPSRVAAYVNYSQSIGHTTKHQNRNQKKELTQRHAQENEGRSKQSYQYM